MLDEKKIDEIVLALLQLTIHDGCCAWKGFDFEVMNRLHKKGFIEDPINKTKSVILTDTGMKESKRQLEKHFRKKGSNSGCI